MVIDKYMKISILVPLFFLWFSTIFANGEVHIHYGDLKRGQKSILNRVFKPKLKELSKLNVEVVEYDKSLQENILASLANPKVVGVIFLGHPAIKTKGTGKKRRIVHGYLKDGEGKYIPKNIFSGAHNNLKFISVLTCHESAIIPLYKKTLPSFIDYFESPSHSLNALDNPLFEFTSFYSTPKVIDNILQQYGPDSLEINSLGDPKEKSLKVNLKDLTSGRFSYTVSINGVLVGIISRQLNSRGRILNDVEFLIKVPESILHESNNLLTIEADDYLRPRPLGLDVVDDILIEKVTLENGGREDSLGVKIHLGDQESNPDIEEGLGFLRNKLVFRDYLFVGPRWELWF